MDNKMKVALGAAMKGALPALLGALGMLAAVVYRDGYHAFCELAV